MSFFIGEDTSGHNIIHITNGSHTIDQMKAGVNADTVFHNDKTFLGYDLYPVTMTKRSHRYTRFNPTYCYWSCDSAGTQLMVGAEFSYFLDSNYGIVTSPFNGYLSSIPPSDVQVALPHSTSQTATHHIPVIGWHNSWPAEPNVSYVLIMSERNLIDSYGVAISSSSNGNRPQFVVGSLDLNNLRYVSRGPINDSPDCPIIDGYHQLIDSSLLGGSIEIDARAVGGTEIRKNGYPIITGKDTRFSGDSVTTNYTIAISNNSKVHVFTAVLDSLHVVIGPNGKDFAPIDGGNHSYMIKQYTDYFWGGVPGFYQWLPITTSVYYVVEGLEIYIQAVTTHRYANQALPPSISFSVEVFGG